MAFPLNHHATSLDWEESYKQKSYNFQKSWKMKEN